MTANDLDPVRETGFQADAAVKGDRLQLTVRGTADLRVQGAFDDMLARVHAHAARQGVREVTLDVRQLDFMNSSCFKCVVTWLHRILQMPTGSRYSLKILASATISWQRRSLHAIKAFAPDLVTIQEQ